MNLKDMVLTSLLLAMGLVLHQVTPPLMGGMKPDFLLAMLFIALFIDHSPKKALLAGLLAGIFAALTTGFPGGQTANLIDKPITAFTVYLLINAMAKFNFQITVALISLLGTIVSGTVFLTSALVIFGSLPGAFSALFTTIVIPTALINTIVTFICYHVITIAKKNVTDA
ncbi:MAG: tryptophan transporter [bacterium]|jgi:hypothetical protein